MRLARRLTGSLLFVVLFGACDSTQPLQVEGQSLALSFGAVNALTKTFDVWDVYEDGDGNEQPDDGQTYLWCQPAQNSPPGPVPPSIPPSTVPWNFSVRIRVLRAGETVADTITSAAALSSTFNVARYDTAAPFLGATAAKAPTCTSGGVVISCPAGSQAPPGGRRFAFRNPRRMSGANVVLMTSVNDASNAPALGRSPLFLEVRNSVAPIFPNEPAARPRRAGQGLCSEGNPGPARIDGETQPYLLDIETGDTVLVEARLATQAPTGPGLSALLLDGGSPPNSLSGTMTLDGRPIALTGSSSGAAVSFSYTAR